MPTARGWLVAAAGIVLAAAGGVLGYRELVSLGCLALAAVAIAVVMVGRPVPLEVRRRAAERVNVDDTVAVRLAVSAPERARQRRAGRPRIRRALVAADWVSGPDGRARRPLPDLRGAPGHADYELVAGRRGVIEIGPLQAGRIDPLGLAATIRGHGGTHRIWVHPRPRRLRKIPGGAVRDLEGHREAASAGGLTFHGLREHVPGDDLRGVHWRSSARHGRLMVRENVDTARPRIVVLVDERAPGPQLFDEVAVAAASVLAVAVRAGLGCELQLAGGRRADDRAGPAAMFDLLAEMSPVQGAAGPGLAPALRLLKSRPPADVVVLLSACADERELGLFAQAGDRYSELVAGLLGGPAGSAPPGTAGLRVVSGQNAAEFAARWDRTEEWR